MSGTGQPRNSDGRVYCGYSSSPSACDSSCERLLAAERARQPPHDGIDEHDRGQLAAGEDVVADADLVVDEVLADALVDALVVAAEEDQPRASAASSFDDRLVEQAALRRQQDDAARRLGVSGRDRLDGLEERAPA